MKWIRLIFALVSCSALIIVLHTRLPLGTGKTPRLGYFLSPQEGFWQNAENGNENFSADLQAADLEGDVDVYLDERLVPHVYAQNEKDVFFVQGYLHAKFRLWQMEFQTHAAGGRLSEIMGAEANGTNFLNVDKFFRRLGMVYGAENSLAEMEKDTALKTSMDAYTAGVNYFVKNLKKADWPVEYKLLDYAPEPWTNLKTALFLKYMSFDLAGYEQDFERTASKMAFTKEQFAALYPYGHDSLNAIVPNETVFAKAGLALKVPADADTTYFNFKQSTAKADSIPTPEPTNGSNNWAVAPSKTANGKAILASDPHLSLNLPALWFEMQISTPNFQSYGASFPGSPNIIIGFNTHAAFGFTNAMRDVRDYFEIQFKDSTLQEYWYDSAWQKTSFREEIIKVKEGTQVVQKIPMTVFGPVMYEPSFPDKLNTGKYWAVRWSAHEGSNELRTFYKLNHAKNINDYTDAISTFKCPGQNMVFACNSGDIAIKQQGKFPAKWIGQGDFLMQGTDESYDWQGYAEDSLNVLMHNPERGFVASANQYPYNTKTYPYYLGGNFALERGYTLNKKLAAMQGITVKDMMDLQFDSYDAFGEWITPVLLQHVQRDALPAGATAFIGELEKWDYKADAEKIGPSIMIAWFDTLKTLVYADEMPADKVLARVDRTTLMEALRKDTSYMFIDDINTPQKELLSQLVTTAFLKNVPVWEKAKANEKLQWGWFKNSSVNHLLKIPAFSYQNWYSSGTWSALNAYKGGHGPSWRMVIEVGEKVQGFAVYPGGQSGNVGSKYYDTFLSDWTAGKYHPVTITAKAEFENGKKFIGKIHFKKA
ncbi:MAG: penicillin acylase family protein [Bacteroidetes bacterium]|nr:MAG: penicillin acylase family protein [Bacteroidota bacterium]